MIFKKATKSTQNNLQNKYENKADIFEEELKVLKSKFKLKAFTYKVLCIGSISLLITASIFYDLIGDWIKGIILFLLSICLTLSIFY